MGASGMAHPPLTTGRSLTEKKVFRNQFSQKSPGHSKCPTMVGGGWRLAVGGGWWLAVGNWRLAAGGWWRLVVGGWWRLVVDGSWRLAVGGPLGRTLRAVLSKKKNLVP